jgi:hypothetical protein
VLLFPSTIYTDIGTKSYTVCGKIYDSGMATRRPRTRRSRGLSTSEYGLPITRTWKSANYAYPRGAGGDRGKRPSYPINNLKRARSALARAAQPGTAGTVRGVKSALRHKGGAYAALANRSSAGRSSGGTRKR